MECAVHLHFLIQRNVNIFASERKVRKEIKEIIHETETWNKTYEIKDKEETKNITITGVRFKNISNVLTDHIKPLMEQRNLLHHRGTCNPRELKMTVIGDNGGEYVKLGVSIINFKHPQSRYSVLPLAMYHGGNESYEYIKDFLQPTISDIEKWAASFPNDHRSWKVRLLNGGDFKWLWTIMGLAHNGTCFCPMCTYSNDKDGEQQISKSKQIKDDCRTHDNHNINRTKLISKTLIILPGQSESAAAENCIRDPLVGRDLYENVIPPTLHIDNGQGTFGMELSLNIQKEKAMLFRFANQAIETPKLQEQIEIYRKFKIDIEKLTETFKVLEKQRSDAEWGTRMHFDGDISDTKALLKSAKETFKKVSDIIYNTKSDYTDQYDALFATIVVCSKTNQGARGQIVGSVVDKMFEPAFISKLSEMLCNGANDEMKSRVNNIITFMNKYSEIRPFLKSTRVMKQKEIKLLQIKCNSLGKDFPVLFPDRAITPKLHMLFVHVPEFAAKHKNLGLFSESVFESIHAEFNQLDRTYACVTSTSKSLELTFAAAEVKRSPRLKKLERTKRKCRCGGYIAQDASDKERCKCEKSNRNQRTS